MPELDTSFYAKTPTTALQTPLDVMGKVMPVIGAMNQNRLFQQTIDAREAIGHAYQGAIDPTTGQIDTNKLMQSIRTDPRAAFMAGDAAAGALTREGQAITNRTGTFDLDAKQRQFMVDGFGSLADKPDLSRKDFSDVAAGLARNTNIPTSRINAMLNNLPNDPNELRRQAVMMRNQALGSTLTAQDATTGIGSNDTPITGTRGQALYERAGAGVGMKGAGAPALPGNVVMLPPGAQKSADMMQEDLGRARNFGQEMVPLTQALEKLKALGPGATGPGSKGRQEIESAIYALSPTISRWAGVDPEKIKNYGELEKYLVQGTQARAQSFGAHTDLGLRTSITGSPNIGVNDMSIGDVLKMAVAVRRMEHAQTLSNAQHGPAGYSLNSAKWATGQDARAYALDQLSPEQVQKLQSELKGQARARFNASLQSAIQAGVIDHPGMQNGR